jgi:hypothetical protein
MSVFPKSPSALLASRVNYQRSNNVNGMNNLVRKSKCSKESVFIFSCALGISIVAAGYTPYNGVSRINRLEMNRIQSIAKIERMIEDLDDWAEIPWGTSEEDRNTIWKGLENKLNDIARYDLTEIRSAIVKYIDEKRQSKSLDAIWWSRLLILNRYLFNVPKTDSTNHPRFGGWMISGQENIDLLWPLSIDEQGKLTLARASLIIYSGPDYNALYEFDYLNKTFGLRNRSVQ